MRGGHVADRANFDPTARGIRLGTCTDRVLTYFAAYIFGITALIGVIIAHIKFPDANPFLRSHYQFQIRTFWIGVLYLVVAVLLAFAVFPVIGVAVLIWWSIWSLVRNVKGLLALNDNKPIQDQSDLLDVRMNPARNRPRALPRHGAWPCYHPQARAAHDGRRCHRVSEPGKGSVFTVRLPGGTTS